MTKWQQSVLFYFLGVISVGACAGKPLYPWYGMSLPDPSCYQKGKLLGQSDSGGSWPDISLVNCEPDGLSQGKCICQLERDFFDKDLALQECQTSLKTCQAGK